VNSAEAETFHQEARDQLQRAMREYAGDDIHVCVYILDRAEGRNALQEHLAETDDITSDPARISKIVAHVETYLDDWMRHHYLDTQG